MTSVSSAQRDEWRAALNERDRTRFVETEFCVDATDEEQHQLWWRWSAFYRVPWEQDSAGSIYTIAQLRVEDACRYHSGDGSHVFHDFRKEILPVAARVTCSLIAGVRVAFLESTSLLVHHGLVEAWREAVFPCQQKALRHSDATNFGNVVNEIGRMIGRELCGRDPLELEHAIEVDSIQYRSDEALKRDPQAAYEWADGRAQFWLDRAKAWRAISEDPNAPVHPVFEMKCGKCSGYGEVTSVDGAGGKYRTTCWQCNGKGKVSVQT